MVQTGTGLIEVIVTLNYLLDYKKHGMSHVPISRLRIRVLLPTIISNSLDIRSAKKHLENQLFWIGKTSNWTVVLDGGSGKRGLSCFDGGKIFGLQKSSLILFNKSLFVPVCQVDFR